MGESDVLLLELEGHNLGTRLASIKKKLNLLDPNYTK
jgi:hypothetical protein